MYTVIDMNKWASVINSTYVFKTYKEALDKAVEIAESFYEDDTELQGEMEHCNEKQIREELIDHQEFTRDEFCSKVSFQQVDE